MEYLNLKKTSFSLDDVPIFSDISIRHRNQLSKCLEKKTYQKGEILLLEGSPCRQIFIIRSGKIKIFRTSNNGREQILDILGPGETCACNPGSTTWSCMTSAMALNSCEVWLLSRTKYLSLIRSNPKFSRALNQILADRLCRFCTLIESISLDSSIKRLIKLLFNAGRSNGSSIGQEDNRCFFLTHEELAQRLGLARETVSRHLHRLKSQKLIDVQSHYITIRNHTELKKILEGEGWPHSKRGPQGQPR